jgi:hypothetical protein
MTHTHRGIRSAASLLSGDQVPRQHRAAASYGLYTARFSKLSEDFRKDLHPVERV